ncbi:MAG: radical SAM protein [Butyrivibrio sp.]|nr:radical SAM protein [Butyrivibrio sp.]
MIYDLVRYQYDDKSALKRENVLLVSLGCSWGKCAFCDYQDDKSSSVLACDTVNKKVLQNVKGKDINCSCLDVTCSASYTELPFTTMNLIKDVCVLKGIKKVILEGHYLYRDSNKYYADFFGRYDINVMFRCGVETFDEHLREDILRKGLPHVTPEQLAKYYQWINIMFGMEGQTLEQLHKDIETGLEYFERINLSIYTSIPRGPKRDKEAIEKFYNSDFYKELKDNDRIDIFDEWDDSNDHKVGHDK